MLTTDVQDLGTSTDSNITQSEQITVRENDNLQCKI